MSATRGFLKLCCDAQLARRPLLNYFRDEDRESPTDEMPFFFKGPGDFELRVSLRIPPAFDEDWCRAAAASFIHEVEADFVSRLQAHDLRAKAAKAEKAAEDEVPEPQA